MLKSKALNGFKRHILSQSLLRAFVGLLVLCSSDLAFAQSGKDKNVKDYVDVVLLLDASGSMRATDPERLRDEGAKLLLQFLKKGDRLAVVEFSKEAKVIRPLESYEPVKALKFARDIESVGSSGFYTNILAGIQQAQQMLRDAKKKGVRQVIILLSDGKFDPDPSQGESKILEAGLIHTVLPELERDGVVVHTLAFSKQSDRELLEEIATITEGAHTYAENPQDIGDAFTRLFLLVKKPVAADIVGRQFKIDGDVRQVTFYVENADKQEISLRAPSGLAFKKDELSKEMTWFQGEGFELVTLKEPEVGIWRVVGVGSNEGFATILTKLKLETDWPTNVIAGEERLLQARLYEEDKPVVLPLMSDATKYAFEIIPTDKVSEPVVKKLLADDGKNGDKFARDGIFSSKVMVNQPGEYRLRILAQSPTFERTQTLPFRVKPRLVSLDIIHVENKAADISNTKATSSDYFRVKLSNEAMTLKKVEVKLIAKDKQGKVYRLPLIQNVSKTIRYEVPTSALPRDGDYELQATIAGENRRKKIMQGSSEVMVYTKKTSAHDKSDPGMQVVVMEEGEKPKKQEEESPLLWSFIAFLVNCGLGGVFFLKVKKSSGGSEVVPVYSPAPELLAAIESLEEKSQATEIDINDSIFQGDGEVAVPSDLGAGAAPDAGSTEEGAQEEAPADSEEPASEEADGDEDAAPEQVDESAAEEEEEEKPEG